MVIAAAENSLYEKLRMTKVLPNIFSAKNKIGRSRHVPSDRILCDPSLKLQDISSCSVSFTLPVHLLLIDMKAKVRLAVSAQPNYRPSNYQRVEVNQDFATEVKTDWSEAKIFVRIQKFKGK